MANNMNLYNVVVSSDADIAAKALELYNTAREARTNFYRLDSSTAKGIVDAARKDLTSAVKAFNDFIKQASYNVLLNHDDALLTALSIGFIPCLNADKDGIEIVSAGVELDLVDFLRYASSNGRNIISGDVFMSPIEELRKVAIGYVSCSEREEEDRFEYVSFFDTDFSCNRIKIDKTLGEADLHNRYSKNNVTRALQAAIDALIYVDETNGGKNKYRALSKDVNHVINVLATRKVGGTAYPTSARAFAPILKDVLVRIITGGEYTESYNKQKKNK